MEWIIDVYTNMIKVAVSCFNVDIEVPHNPVWRLCIALHSRVTITYSHPGRSLGQLSSPNPNPSCTKAQRNITTWQLTAGHNTSTRIPANTLSDWDKYVQHTNAWIYWSLWDNIAMLYVYTRSVVPVLVLRHVDIQWLGTRPTRTEWGLGLGRLCQHNDTP